jgi:hypothetical protein
MKLIATKQHGSRHDRHRKRRVRGGGTGGPNRHAHAPPLTLTEEGVPAAVPDGPRPSPAVFVSDESRATYPWLPGRVIAGSVWRGPRNERVKVDEAGNAVPWRARAAPVP